MSNDILYSNLLYNILRYVCVCVCMFLIGGQTAGPVGIKLGTRIHLDPGSALSKSRSRSRPRSMSRSERRRRENESAVGVDSLHREDGYYT